LIGGDLAYDDGNLNCYFAMDFVLSILAQNINPNLTINGEQITKLVPLIIAVGNHDVGYNNFPNFEPSVATV